MEPELNTELRPCPFCGNKNPQRYRTVDLADNEQYNVYCLCFHGETLHWKPWQDAYCWREIDSLKFQLKERDEKIENLMLLSLPRENAALKQRVGELETDNRNANNAYKEIETLFEVRTTELESQQRQDNALILELKAKLAEAEKALT